MSGNLWWALTTPPKKTHCYWEVSHHSIGCASASASASAQKRTQSACACLTPQLVNCHGSMASFSDLPDVIVDARPGPPGSHHTTKGAHTCHLVENYCQVYVLCMYIYMYVCMMSIYHVVCIYDELCILL